MERLSSAIVVDASVLETLFDLNLEIIVPSSEILLKTSKKARNLYITVYDSVYLVLIEEIAGYIIQWTNIL